MTPKQHRPGVETEAEPSNSESSITAEAPAVEPEQDETAEITAVHRKPILTQPGGTWRRVRWVWPGRIPLGKITMLDGPPGVSKSTITVDLTARVSSGREMADGSSSDLNGPADAIMIFCEDDLADTVGPRLEVAGAELSRVHVLEGLRTEDGKRRHFTLKDLAVLQDAIRQTGAKLVTIDPFGVYVPGNANREDEMRAILTPLGDLAREMGVAIVIVRHLRKADGSALSAGLGSIGIGANARAVLIAREDPDDESRCVLAVAKNNLAARPPSLTYTRESAPIEIEGERTTAPRIVWGEESTHTADDLMAQPDPRERAAAKSAEEIIKEVLEGEPMPAEPFQKAVTKRAVSARTFQRARSKLHKARIIWRWKQGGIFDGGWYWGLGSEPSAEWLSDQAKWAGQ